MSLTVMLCNIDELEHFKWKWPFDPCDPKWPQIELDPITWVEGLKVMYMYELHEYTLTNRRINAF